MSALPSVSSATFASASQPVGKWEQLGAQLKSMNDEQLSEWVASNPAAKLAPGAYEIKEWLEHMPYQRILGCCNSEQARVSICWMTSGAMLANCNSVVSSIFALNVFNSADRLPVFVQAMRESRTLYMNSINVNDLLLRDSSPDSPFHNALPVHIKAILNMENPRNFDRSVSVEAIDARIDAYVEGVQKEQADKASVLPSGNPVDHMNKV